MDIIGKSTTSGETFVIFGTDGPEGKQLIEDLRREVESGRTQWFLVRGTGVEDHVTQAALDPDPAITLQR